MLTTTPGARASRSASIGPSRESSPAGSSLASSITCALTRRPVREERWVTPSSRSCAAPALPRRAVLGLGLVVQPRAVVEEVLPRALGAPGAEALELLDQVVRARATRRSRRSRPRSRPPWSSPGSRASAGSRRRSTSGGPRAPGRSAWRAPAPTSGASAARSPTASRRASAGAGSACGRAPRRRTPASPSGQDSRTRVQSSSVPPIASATSSGSGSSGRSAARSSACSLFHSSW